MSRISLRLLFTASALLVSAAQASTYDKVLQVGPAQTITRIQQAVDGCQSTQRCEIRIDAGTYNEQVSVSGKRNMWIHGSDPTNPPVIRYLDTVSTQPKDRVSGDGSDNWAYYSERNGVVRVMQESDSIRVSDLIIDGIRHFTFQWQNIWGSPYQFSGNSGVAITGAHAVQVDHCLIRNTFWGIHFKDRNTGGVYANLDVWEVLNQAATATPFSNFGRYGGHLFEYNRIYSNVWAFYAEQTWDLPATIRFNIAYNNKADTSADFDCTNRITCGVSDNPSGDRQYHAGGFLFLKDAMLVTHIIHNNTIYGSPQTIAGYYKAGKNHIFYNNIIDQRTGNMLAYPNQSVAFNIVSGYGNAHNNVISDNTQGTFPLFGNADSLFTKNRLQNLATAPVDSFEAPAGYNNFWYKAPEYLSTDPTSANFLCPDWSKPSVIRTIMGKGWNRASSSGTSNGSGLYVPDPVDVGALSSSGGGCAWGGVQDTIGIHLEAASPILFYNTADARFQFKIHPISAQDSDFTEITYHYTSYVDSLPFPASPGTITGEKSPVPGLTGLLNMGHNDVSFSFPRSSLGEYGELSFSVHAKHRNGRTYVSNLEVVEYRRLHYTMSISLYNSAGTKVDTVNKGDTVRADVQVLDINLNNATGGIVYGPRARFINSSIANWSQMLPDNFVGSASSKFVITSYTGSDEILSIGGIVGEVVGADTAKYFIAGTAPFYIQPSNASKLVISNKSLVAPQNEPLTVTVDVQDVFGTYTDEPVSVRLTADDGTLVGPTPQVFINKNGKLTFTVTPTGAIGQHFTLQASIDGRSVNSTPVTFTIAPPSNRKVVIVNKPSTNYHYAAGEVVPFQLKLVDGSGNLLPMQDFFGLSIRNSHGVLTTIPTLYNDSASAALGVRGNNSGQFSLVLPSTGMATFYIKWPYAMDSSDVFSVQTGPTDMTSNIIWDEAPVNVDVPQLVFVDMNGNSYTTPPPIDTVTGYYMPLSVQARINGIVCTQCNDTVYTTASSPFIHFKTNSNGADVTSFSLANGQSDLIVYATKQVMAGEFTLYSRDSATVVTYDSLKFRKPPVPQADSAVIFDTNGDGIGDSIAVYYGEGIRDSLPDTLVYAWPAASDANTMIPLPSNVLPGNDSVISWTGPMTDSILTSGTGKLMSVYQDNEGQWWTQRLDIQDRIGPVVKSASLVQSWGGAQDTLYVRFSEPLDTSAIGGSPFVVNGLTAAPVGAKGIKIDDSTWIFLMNKNQVQEGDSLNLFAMGPVKDAAGNSPSVSNKGIHVSLIRRPVPTSQKGNLFQDRDGDGTLDRVVIELLGPVDQNYLQNELDSIVFTWVDSSGHVQAFKVAGPQFTIDPADPTHKRLIYDIPNPKTLYPYLTSIDTTRFGAYGTSTMYATVPGESQSVLPVKMTDGMPPVIKEASLKVADNDGGDDILTITFSEPVDYANADNRNLFDIKPRNASDTRILEYSSYEWKNGNTIALTFSKDIGFDRRPSSQDSIRIHAGALSDSSGISVPTDAEFAKQSPGIAARPFKMVVGDFRFSIATVAKISYDVNDPTLKDLPPMETVYRDFGTKTNPTQDLGMMVDLGSVDLKHSVQRAIKQRKYPNDDSKLIEDMPVDASKIKFRLQLDLFTSIAGFVTSKAQTLSCSDTVFHGDCITNPEQVFLRWNFKSQEGRFVGTGAFFAQLYMKVWYEGDATAEIPSVKVAERSKIETWGVIRRTDGSRLRN